MKDNLKTPIARHDERPDAYNEAARVMAEREQTLCDCERSHYGIGMSGRICDCPARNTTEAEVDQLAQVIRQAHVMTQIGRNSGFAMTPWETLTGRERAPYIASSVAAFRYFKKLERP